MRRSKGARKNTKVVRKSLRNDAAIHCPDWMFGAGWWDQSQDLQEAVGKAAGLGKAFGCLGGCCIGCQGGLIRCGDLCAEQGEAAGRDRHEGVGCGELLRPLVARSVRVGRNVDLAFG